MNSIKALLFMAAVGCGASHEAQDIELAFEDYLGSIPYDERQGGYLLDGRVLSGPELRARFEARLAESAGPEHDSQTGCAPTGGGELSGGFEGSPCPPSGPQPIP